MKVLVTGGAGYIGSVLVPRLMASGHYVTVLDNFMYKQSPLNHLCSDPHFEVVRGDTRDARIVEPLIKQADLIIPLAAIVGAPVCDQDRSAATTTNCSAIQLAVNLMSKDQWMIIPITNSGYGIGDLDKECTEDSPLNPISHYGQTKVMAEKIALERSNCVSLRLATVFGMSPRMRLDLLVNNFVYRAIADCTVVLFESHFRRNFIHVRDVASVFEYTIRNFDTMRTWSFNIGLSDANLSKRELCQKIKEQIPEFIFVEAEIGKDPDQRNYVVSNAKIEKHGFLPKYSLEYGIAELKKGLVMLRDRRYGNV